MLFNSKLFKCISRVRKISKSDYWFRLVCLSVDLSFRLEQLGSRWTDFHTVWHLSIVSKIQVWLKSDKNNGYFLRHMYIYDNISLDSFRMRYVSNKSCREIQEAHLIFSNLLSGNHIVYEIMWNKYVCMYVCMYSKITQLFRRLDVALTAICQHGSTVVNVLRYKSEGRWFDPRWCGGNFHWHSSFWSRYGPGVDSASNRNEYQEPSWE
jgi:hypothetical protein